MVQAAAAQHSSPAMHKRRLSRLPRLRGMPLPTMAAHPAVHASVPAVESGDPPVEPSGSALELAEAEPAMVERKAHRRSQRALRSPLPPQYQRRLSALVHGPERGGNAPSRALISCNGW